MNTKQKITIRLAGFPPMPLMIDSKTEEVVRLAEKEVNNLYANYLQKFPSKNDGEVLAMVAFQFAKLYFTNVATETAAEQMLTDFEKRLDEILLKVD
ncbi:MAG: cell division protein ZapA [Muribaculaceae bacterium]|nr:cell division protein ZapA [Muribaculaceae bacterium]